MPELPEVETTCNGIRPFLQKQTISRICVRQKQLRWLVPVKTLQEKLVGQQVVSVKRRAKYILIELPSGHLIIHLGMSGCLRILPKGTPLQKHDHFDCEFNNLILRYNDPRRFGAILWHDPNQTLPQLSHLGPEPLESAFTPTYLYQAAKRHRTCVKTLIMNQKIVVGVGNIYASESLFLARVHPLTPANQLSLVQCQRIQRAVQKILTQAIQQGGTTLKDFKQSDGKPGYFALKLKVYDKAGKPCSRCHTPIQSIRLAQRATYFCPHCQSYRHSSAKR